MHILTHSIYTGLIDHVKSHAKMYRELILFIIFVLLFMTITSMHRDVFNTHISNLLLFKVSFLYLTYCSELGCGYSFSG